jgi:hypothetical protein
VRRRSGSHRLQFRGRSTKRKKHMSKTGNKPTHRAYAVTRNKGKSYWREIGAARAHEDGKGFGLKLDYLPLDPNAELVIRELLPPQHYYASSATHSSERVTFCIFVDGRFGV